MSKCLCGSKLLYEACCGLYHHHQQMPSTPEALMRSRYSAYALANMDYIKQTMRGKPLISFNESDAKAWAKRVKWIKLTIIEASPPSSDNIGYVEFIAHFIEDGQHCSIHERSEFHLIDDQWFYVDGVSG